MQNTPAPTPAPAPVPAPTPLDPPTDFHGGRVLIPRVERPTPPVPVEKRRRVAKACVNCRKRKTKCTGSQPRCHECEVNNLPCVYEQHRKDRLRELSEQKQFLVSLLKDLHLNVNSSDRKRIQDTLEELDEDLPDPSAPVVPLCTATSTSKSAPPVLDRTSHSATSTEPPIENTLLPEQHLLPVAANAEPLDYVTTLEAAPSLTNDTTDLDWFQKLQPEMASSDADYYINNDPFDVDDTVDVKELPPIGTAQQLYQNYSRTVNDWLPILPTTFDAQFHKYLGTSSKTVPDKWLSILNLVFAIGARYSRLVDEKEGENDVVYFSRAVQLLRRVNKEPIFSTPDLALVQAHALLALYYLATGQADKAWTTIGMAVRSALAEGLHLQNNAQATTLRKEMSTRTWWSLHLLECLTSSITGRPCTAPFDHCNTPLPRTLSGGELESTTVPLLRAQIQISLIAHQALAKLYSVQAANTPWDRIQKTVTQLLVELEERSPHIDSFSSQRERLLFQFAVLSTKLNITRPCLCPRSPQGQGHDGKPSLDTTLAETCVQTALDLANLLPDKLDKSILKDVPWWCLVYYLMQAVAVFLLNMSCGGSQSAGRSLEIASLKKLVRWLRLMRGTNVAAGRAVQVVMNVLQKAHSQVDIADLLEEETAGIYGFGFVPGTYNFGMTSDLNPVYAQLMPEFNAQLQQPALNLSHLSDSLPPPARYGDPFPPDLDEPAPWAWGFGTMGNQ